MTLANNDLVDGLEAARLLRASIYTVRDYKRLGLIKIAGKQGNKDFYSRTDVVRRRSIIDHKRIEGYTLSQISAVIEEELKKGD
jgi:DNA-binding transcriptional MerR regulator